MTKRKPIVTSDNVGRVIEELLSLPFWPEGIESGAIYRVQTDDTDGREDYGWLMIQYSCDGDAHVRSTCWEGIPDDIRFRTFFGGGTHLRVYNAIHVLAIAMKMDMEGHGRGAPFD
jgi:hypothetical protein